MQSANSAATNAFMHGTDGLRRRMTVRKKTATMSAHVLLPTMIALVGLLPKATS